MLAKNVKNEKNKGPYRIYFLSPFLLFSHTPLSCPIRTTKVKMQYLNILTLLFTITTTTMVSARGKVGAACSRNGADDCGASPDLDKVVVCNGVWRVAAFPTPPASSATRSQIAG